MINVRVDAQGLAGAIIDACHEAVGVALQEQILQDANYFCLQDQGALMASAIASTDKGGGEITWNTPYAKRRYYEPTPRRGVNPNAKLHWAEEAVNTYQDDWAKLIAKEAGALL